MVWVLAVGTWGLGCSLGADRCKGGLAMIETGRRAGYLSVCVEWMGGLDRSINSRLATQVHSISTVMDPSIDRSTAAGTSRPSKVKQLRSIGYVRPVVPPLSSVPLLSSFHLADGGQSIFPSVRFSFFLRACVRACGAISSSCAHSRGPRALVAAPLRSRSPTNTEQRWWSVAAA